jgi:SAM-dependent methyltransferase
MKKELHQKAASKRFYEERYSGDYMDQWPEEKKEKVFDLIHNLQLPETGIALDYGCGSGEFTGVLQKALPGWEIVGCDISLKAINKAIAKNRGCGFFEVYDKPVHDLKFDLLFTHHVLEHVYDIEKVMDEMNQALKPESVMVHICPCGNEGSLEYKICQMRTGGINTDMENRFFFEDEGHLRRLTTERANELTGKFGFVLEQEYYRYQHFGSINWISQRDENFILDLTDATQAVNGEAARKLRMLRKELINYRHLRDKLTQRNKRGYEYTSIKMVENAAASEWKYHNRDRNGSEMYLVYRRSIEG